MYIYICKPLNRKPYKPKAESTAKAKAKSTAKAKAKSSATAKAKSESKMKTITAGPNKGWIVEVRERKGGESAGQTDTYYRSPTGGVYRTRGLAQKHGWKEA